MTKMMKPEAEIIRFGGGIDVIATSGNFYALGSEVYQGTNSVAGEVGEWYSAPTKDGAFSKVSGGFTNVNREGIYVWYDNGAWQTEDCAIRTYQDSIGNWDFRVDDNPGHDHDQNDANLY